MALAPPQTVAPGRVGAGADPVPVWGGRVPSCLGHYPASARTR
ncbi:MAG: hypothetical protein AVDCRST_MAG73-4236 [uncultured Thermomicrobiales bacterium]|uniref:Uncharacterized protein n=1 Tax=uncultured Thermomicrobiales bacterium TaxID=1645740 RepID=A0A6J4V6B3_9BACT|nr:MAG: hypothetical protein AVDCRST_MAG73-4236 [uncultured Thermomicrobiales bacterium]